VELLSKACCLDQLQSIQPEDLNVTISPDSQSCPTDSKFMDNFGIKRTFGTDHLFVIIDPVWVATVGDPSAVYITEGEVIGCGLCNQMSFGLRHLNLRALYHFAYLGG